jgi:hypothetical protein
LPGLPDPDQIRRQLEGTAFQAEVERTGAKVLRHVFPILGMEIETGREIQWRHDYLNHRSSGRSYFRLIPYLDFARVGDHKVIWELNRHQHLVLLAQALVLSGNQEYFHEILRQWESWVLDNPYQCGINWASALEVAFRALSWIWVYHLAGHRMESGFRRRFLNELYRHGCHLERNLSYYFSPNTHLLGEAVALHALGALFPEFPRAVAWKRTGARVVQEQLVRQVRGDGAHFEQSTYYHVYALDLLLFHYVLAGRPETFKPVLTLMAEYLWAVLGPERALPFIGDDDGGRVFFPYGKREEFGRATLATCAVLLNRNDWPCTREDFDQQATWWLGQEAAASGRCAPKSATSMRSHLFRDTGVAVMAAGDLAILADGGGFGPFKAGHSHSDTLSLVARAGERELLVDAGTYTYVADRRWRDWFRGSAAHNTVRVDERDQATPSGPFGWKSKPEVRMRQWASTEKRDYLDAECRVTAGGLEVVHRRRWLLIKPDLLFILDEIQGEGEHLVEQFWHPGETTEALSPQCFRIGTQARLVIAEQLAPELSVGGQHGWRSTTFGQRNPAPVVVASRRTPLPCFAAAALVAGEGNSPLTLNLSRGHSCFHCELQGDRATTADFPF